MNIDRYLKIVKWARRRYTVGGWLAVSTGGKPTRYARIEIAAWRRYGCGACDFSTVLEAAYRMEGGEK